MWIKIVFFSVALICTYNLKSQDTTEPWFPGGDPGFYRYLEDRMQALGSQQPSIDKNGESVVFEFYVTDSGFVDSVRIQQCFNFQLCYQLRQVLNTMPRCNASVLEGSVVSERRVYVLDIRRMRDGYIIEPSVYIPYYGSFSNKMKWAIVLVAVVATMVLIIK